MVIKTNLDIDRGLVLHLPLNEGAGLTAFDRSENQNHGTLTNVPTWVSSVRGDGGQALDFDNGGNETLFFGTPASLDNDGDSEVSAFAWVKPDDISHTATVLRRHTATTNCQGTLRLTAAGKVSALITTDIDGFAQPNDTQITMLVDTVYHGGFVYDGAYIRFYVNGRAVDKFAHTGVLARSIPSSDVYVSAPSAEGFDGIIQDVRAYDRALSAQEVQQLYNMRRRV